MTIKYNRWLHIFVNCLFMTMWSLFYLTLSSTIFAKTLNQKPCTKCDNLQHTFELDSVKMHAEIEKLNLRIESAKENRESLRGEFSRFQGTLYALFGLMLGIVGFAFWDRSTTNSKIHELKEELTKTQSSLSWKNLDSHSTDEPKLPLDE